MSRIICQQCQRPEKTCICAFAAPIKNNTHVVVLQHPSEVKQSKGSVSLLQLSLAQCEVIVGESFADHQRLAEIFKQHGDNIALVYPSENAQQVNFLELEKPKTPAEYDVKTMVKCIVILDGTWKKAYRMFMLNPSLHKLHHLTLPSGIESLYNIRKTKKNNALSSLEACCHILARLENNSAKYQPLLESFKDFNLFQQSFSQ